MLRGSRAASTGPLWPILVAGLLCASLLTACGGGARPRPAHAAGLPAAETRAFQSVLDHERDFQGVPGMAAAVVVPGRGVWSGGSGVADRRSGRTVTGR